MAAALRAVEFYSGIGGMHYALKCKLESIEMFKCEAQGLVYFEKALYEDRVLIRVYIANTSLDY